MPGTIFDSRKLCAVTFAILMIGLLPGSALAGPRLLIENPRWDFGKVYAGQQPEHVYILKNTGDGPLTIEQVRPSCAPCAGSMLTGKTIAPNLTGQLRGVRGVWGHHI